MPRHLISNAHEWINEIPTVPIYWRAEGPAMVFATLGKRHRCQPSADDSPPCGVRRATKEHPKAKDLG